MPYTFPDKDEFPHNPLSRQTPSGRVSIYWRVDNIDQDPPNSEQYPEETKIAIISPPGVPVHLGLDDFPAALGQGWLTGKGQTFPHSSTPSQFPINQSRNLMGFTLGSRLVTTRK